MMHFANAKERLIAEQAVLAYRAVQEAADRAEFGHGLEAIEDAALKAGREQSRRLIESAMRRAAAEKASARARAVEHGPRSSGAADGR
jgi:hypothetical protein